jgi:hypothetical protein
LPAIAAAARVSNARKSSGASGEIVRRRKGRRILNVVADA